MNYALCIWKKVKYKFAKRVMWLKLDMEEINGLGIPFFVNEDGRKTCDINKALGWIGQSPVKDEEIL